MSKTMFDPHLIHRRLLPFSIKIINELSNSFELHYAILLYKYLLCTKRNGAKKIWEPLLHMKLQRQIWLLWELFIFVFVVNIYVHLHWIYILENKLRTIYFIYVQQICHFSF